MSLSEKAASPGFIITGRSAEGSEVPGAVSQAAGKSRGQYPELRKGAVQRTGALSSVADPDRQPAEPAVEFSLPLDQFVKTLLEADGAAFQLTQPVAQLLQAARPATEVS